MQTHAEHYNNSPEHTVPSSGKQAYTQSKQQILMAPIRAPATHHRFCDLFLNRCPDWSALLTTHYFAVH